jgi:lipopolysaccharide transport system ATP-binding protein
VNDPIAITVTNISKKFRIFKSPRDRLKEALSLTGKSFHSPFWALRNVSFSVSAGHTMGILGINGSGKSTLLKIICGYMPPTSGNVFTSGRVASILELGTGFNRDFTGRENVVLYGGLMGLTKKEIHKKMPDIECFADIGDFFDRPIRMYSSGMFTRLAFACTIHMEPDILIIDEALAVGDISFQHKCIDRIKQLQQQRVTILLVSHSIGAIKSLCQEAILLSRGQIIQEGTAEDVANFYHGLLARNEQKKPVLQESNPAKDKAPAIHSDEFSNQRVGTGEVRLDSVWIEDRGGNLLKAVDFDQEINICATFTARVDCNPAVFGCLIRDRFGVDLLGTNTAVEGLQLPDMKRGERCKIIYRMRLPLLKGSYSLTVAVGHDPERPLFYDWWDSAYVFEMIPPTHRKIVNCKLHIPIKIDIEKNFYENSKK